MPSSYTIRKARMDRDPGFAARVIGHQMAARKRRRDREWAEHERLNGKAVCHHRYPEGRRCWRIEEHNHAEETTHDQSPV